MESSHPKSAAESDRPEEPDKHDSKRAERLGAMIVDQKPAAAPERLGHLIVEAEQKAAKKPKAEKTPETKAPLNIETMKRAELLELSASIYIDGSNLRQIYETKLIGERGLRRLVAEYMRGGDVKKMLQQEIIEREIDFERDPALRNRQRWLYTNFSNNGLKHLLDKVIEDEAAEDKEETAYHRARAAYDTWQQSQGAQKRRLVDLAMGTTIAVLILLLIILLITRH